MPASIASDTSSSFSEWIDEKPLKAVCLFCCFQEEPLIVIQHLREFHEFEFTLDFYTNIKLINYTRENVHLNPQFNKDMIADYSDDKYLIPFIQDDPLLYSLEFITDDADNAPTTIPKLATSSQSNILSMLKDCTIDEPKTNSHLPNDGYFSSYASNQIHQTMLSDTIRTDAYRDFIYLNKDLFNDKTVLDIGCGTGILSMFSKKAGAKQVIAADNSDIIHSAIKIAQENNIEITFKKSLIEDLEIEKVDVIISEWMGYFLLFEGMLDSVIQARKKLLKPNGIILPSNCTMHLCILDTSENSECFWDNVYGFKMTSMINNYEAIVNDINPSTIISNSIQLIDLDISTAEISDLDFTTSFSILISRDGSITSFCGWFDTFFKGFHPISFSTGPNHKTHWKQTEFILNSRINVLTGDFVNGVFKLEKSSDYKRDLEIEISFEVVRDGIVLKKSVQEWIVR